MSEFEKIAAVTLTIIYFIWIVCLKVDFSIASLLLLLICIMAAIAFAVIYYTRPTVVFADNEKLRYRHIFGEKVIKYSDIKSIVCEPYTFYARYTHITRIKLAITVINDDEYELNDDVDTNEMLKDRLSSRKTDIPLVRLYEFILQHTENCRHE